MSVLTPGQNTAAHDAALQKGVAEGLHKLQDQNSDPISAVPPQAQSPVNDDLSRVMEKPGFEMDLEDFMDGEHSRPRSEPAKNFLKVFIDRLKKLHPGGSITMEEKT